MSRTPTVQPPALTGTPSDRRKQSIERRLASLATEHAAAYKQLDREQSDVNKVRIRAQIEDIDQEIEEEDTKLQQLERKADPRQRYTGWQDDLPQIDFKEAARIFGKILDGFEETGGAALFLMQNCNSLGGKWCVRRLKSMLKAKRIKEHRIVFPAHMPLNERILLEHLGGCVGQEAPPEDLDPDRYKQAIKEYAQAVVHKMRDSFQRGSVVFIELNCWNTGLLEDQFLPCFLDNFWLPLASANWPTIARDYPLLKLIAVILIDAPLPQHLPPLLFCTEESFDKEKVLELPLRPWTLDEIKNWLCVFSELNTPEGELGVKEIEQMASAIYLASENGKPALVCNALMERLEQYFS